MASVSGISSSSSIYGSRNVISGLASGMDTESMIENAVSGIKARITALSQKQTKVGWQQDSYRSIISKMYDFTKKYTSYTSDTNLFSSSFFNNSVTTTTSGANKDMVSATGKTSSDVEILGIQQLATASRYAQKSGGVLAASNGKITGDRIDLDEMMDVSTITGGMTLRYGTRNVELDFGELDTYKNVSDLRKGIEEKLKEQTMITNSGETVTADTRIGIKVSDGKLSFYDKVSNNSVSISSASGDFKKKFNIDPSEGSSVLDANSIMTGDGDLNATESVKTAEYLEGKTVEVTYNGVTKKIKLPAGQTRSDGSGGTLVMLDVYKKDFQTALDNAFGTTANGDSKVKVERSDRDADGKFAFTFSSGEKGSTLSINSDVGEKLGIGNSSASYLDTSLTLKELAQKGVTLGTAEVLKGEGKANLQEDGVTYLDDKGQKVDKDNNRLDKDGDILHKYVFEANGVKIGEYNESTALETIMKDLNNNKDAGIKVNYSKTTNQFVFTAAETGVGRDISFDSEFAQNLFGKGGNSEKGGDGFEMGQDAVLSMSVNGEKLENITRSTNTFDVDGLKVTLKGKFGYIDNPDIAGEKKLDTSAEAVTFTSKADTDKIVDAIKSMVQDYNEMIKEIKEAYSTMPAEKNTSTHAKYEPLTEEDKADMSESAIKAYEEKAKQGILFADRNLSSLYSGLRAAVSGSGSDGAYLRSIGIGTDYSNGLSTISLDESKLRAALETDPDSVRDAFVKTKENGSATDGLMQGIKIQLDRYAKTTGEPKGILIQHSGSPLAPTSLQENTLQSQLDSLSKQIEKWETKMSNQIDRFTSQFSRLEQMIAQMNSQSSMLTGMMGGAG